MSPVHLAKAVMALRAGGVIAYPTEAVWGLGCDPFDEHAVRHLLVLKQRPEAKGLIVVAADISQIQQLFAPLSREQMDRLQETWPGPNTWIIPVDTRRVPEWIRGKHLTQAFRVSNHPVVRELCRRFGGPIVSTSANLSGRAPARSLAEVRKQFGQRIDAVVPAPLGGLGRPTTIRDIVSGAVIRN